MITKWNGNLRIAFIRASVDDPRYDPLEENWRERLLQRIDFDPDPITGVDRSLRAYITKISNGRAHFRADVFGPVTVGPCNTGAAINAIPTSHLYDVACVVFSGGHHACGGMAILRQEEPFPHFDPPRTPNRLHGWCRVQIESSLGTWAMELLHAATGFDDLYKTSNHPGAFDLMACNCGTHPSSYTKWKLGWIHDAGIKDAVFTNFESGTYTLYGVSLPHPESFVRTSAIRIRTDNANHYLLVETRLRTDKYERETDNVSSGIPSEGVVVYEVNEDGSASPVKLRTSPALVIGQEYSNDALGITVVVTNSVPGGFEVRIISCRMIRRQIVTKQRRIEALERRIEMEGETPVLRDMILELRAQISILKHRATQLGCNI